MEQETGININWINPYWKLHFLCSVDDLFDPSFQVVNRFFVLSFQNKAVKQHSQDIFFSKSGNKRLKCYDWNFFGQPVKNTLRAYDNIRKTVTG